MKQRIFIFLLLISSVTLLQAQSTRGQGGKRGFSLSNLSSSSKNVPDSLLVADSTKQDSVRIIAYRLTDQLGDPYRAPLDTAWLDFYNISQVENNQRIAVGYLANLGAPEQSKIFSERGEEHDFVFATPFDRYFTWPQTALFYNTKIPYTNILYTEAGASVSRQQQLKGTLTMNFGPKINIGGDLDYIYSRGYYNSLSANLLSYRLFGSYNSDRYSIYAYLSNGNFVVYENGGITDPEYITNPEKFTDGKRGMKSQDIPTRFSKTWNRVRGKTYFFTQRYNLGFYREVEKADLDTTISVFVPVSSIIHTFEYSDNRRRFTSQDPGIMAQYPNKYTNMELPNDTTKYWKLKNTLGLSLREGFQDWAKFGLTAFTSFEKRRFTQPDSAAVSVVPPATDDETNPPVNRFSTITDEYSLTIGAELSKRQGSILTYNARGELAVLGDDIGEFRVTGELETKFKLFKKDASIRAHGYIKNTRPAFYQRHYHSTFFWWDNDFSDTQRIFAGADINLASSRTKLSAGIESIQNYIYFDEHGLPVQAGKNIQVISARLKQDFRYRAFNWENDVVYQLTSDKSILPLPQLSAYSNLFLAFRLFHVLDMQLGADLHYQTAYYAPYYEPASMQFQLQNKGKIGNYPLMNVYANLKLKQARFYVMMYNVSQYFAKPNYFSLYNYPLNPHIFEMGIAVLFNN
ncbi:putative porin [Parabacteroides pacaensis]|uniref:putative porin n=1 Tax=Parabacteroides pacaensis TaxID=2086575 RepID=UPI000D0E44A0|nr:putative porin [Parabacteroides pacaensis]